MPKLKVVLFSGGNGCASISQAFVAEKNVELTILVNCYDDGKSTGRLRHHIPGMLGPSDIRKNVARLSGHNELEDRRTWAISGSTSKMWMKTFFEYGLNLHQPFGTEDCPVGNVLFAGAYLLSHDFNACIDAFQSVFPCGARILNVSDGKNLWLKVMDSAGRWYTEGELVVASALTRFSIMKFEDDNGCECKPQLNIAAKQAIENADVIVMGPGTQHSSLLPSYRTEGIGTAILHSKALRVWIGNIAYDADIQMESIKTLQEKTYRALLSTSEVEVMWDEFVDRSLVHKGEIEWRDAIGRNVLDDWSNGGVHDGGKVVKAVLSMV